MTVPKMCPRKQHLATVLRQLEVQAQDEARVLTRHAKRLGHAYYGLAIPPALLAAAATATALAEYTMIAGICAGVAAIMSSILVYLRNPYEKALAERVAETRYLGVQTSAHALRIRARDVSYESLERQTVRLETELEILRLSRVDSGASSADRPILIAATVLVLQLAVTVALTGSDRAHALSHLPAAFAALGLLWVVRRLWHTLNSRFEQGARRGLMAALCVGATTWSCEAIAALGWGADGYTERWPALTALHDSILVNISVAGVLLIPLASLIALIAMTMRGLRPTRSRHAP